LKEAALMEIVKKDSAERKKIDQFAKNKKSVLSTPTDKGISKKKKDRSASKK
jgi:hypothetical protein